MRASLKVLEVEGKQRYLLNMESPVVEWTIQQILKIYPDHCDFDIVDVESSDLERKSVSYSS